MKDVAIPFVTITFEEDDPYSFTVEPGSTYYPDGTAEVVSTAPRPTWPSPSEIHDLLAEAVRTVLDRMYEFDTGEAIERNA